MPAAANEHFLEHGIFNEIYDHGNNSAGDAAADSVAERRANVESAAAGGAAKGGNQALKDSSPIPPPTAPEIVLAFGENAVGGFLKNIDLSPLVNRVP